MVITAKLSVMRDDVEPTVFDRLVGAYPRGKTSGGHFRVALSQTNPDMVNLLKILRDASLTPCPGWRTPKKGREFSLHLERSYTQAELAAYEFLELSPPPEATNYNAVHRSDDMIMIPADSQPDGDPDLLRGMPTWYFVPTRVKSLLEKSGLTGIQFKPTVFIPRHGIGRVLVGEESPYWELDSGLTMPPVSPDMSLVDNDGHPVRSGDVSNGFHRREGLFFFPELHYWAPEGKLKLRFDLARTFEAFNSKTYYEPLDRPIVASKRFFDFCVEHGVKTRWVPVHVNSDRITHAPSWNQLPHEGS
jgi:hypothetical protein